MNTYQDGRNRPRKKSLGMFVSYYLHKFFKLNESQTKNFLDVIFLHRGFFQLLNSSSFSRSSSKFKEFSLMCLVVG